MRQIAAKHRRHQMVRAKTDVRCAQFPKRPIDHPGLSIPHGLQIGGALVRTIPFEKSLSRDFRVLKRGSRRFLSFTKRLQLLRNNKARSSRTTARQRYLVQAEEYRFQAETFRDPKTQAQSRRSSSSHADMRGVPPYDERPQRSLE